MKNIQKLISVLVLLFILFTSSAISNRVLAFSGTVSNLNGQVFQNAPAILDTIVNITQADISSALPFNFNQNCGPITTWDPTTLLYYDNGSTSGLQQQVGSGVNNPITQTQVDYHTTLSTFRGVTWLGVKEGIIYQDNPHADSTVCNWYDPNETVDINSGAFTSNSTPLISLTNLPFSFNYVPNVFSVGTVTVSPNPAQINNATSATASFLDASGGSSDTASWNWGDGNTTTGTVTESSGSGSVTDSHTYTDLGSYTITLTVTNNVGSSSSSSVVAVIPTNGLSGANLSHKNYSGANLSGQDISKANLSVATFNNVDFASANLSQVNGSNSSFTNDDFTDANLNKANFSNSNLTNVNFTGANLQGSNLGGTTKTGIIWSNTTCPNGTNSNNDDGTCIGQGGGL